MAFTGILSRAPFQEGALKRGKLGKWRLRIKAQSVYTYDQAELAQLFYRHRTEVSDVRI